METNKVAYGAESIMLENEVEGGKFNRNRLDDSARVELLFGSVYPHISTMPRNFCCLGAA